MLLRESVGVTNHSAWKHIGRAKPTNSTGKGKYLLFVNACHFGEIVFNQFAILGDNVVAPIRKVFRPLILTFVESIK